MGLRLVSRLVGMLFLALVMLGRVDALAADQGFQCALTSVHNKEAFNFAQLRGQRYVLQVFAPWCKFCIQVHPMLVALGKEVPMYGIAWRDNPSNVRHWLASRGDPYKFVGTDDDGSCLSGLKVAAVPYTFIIDESGKVLFGAPTTSLTKEQIVQEFRKR